MQIKKQLVKIISSPLFIDFVYLFFIIYIIYYFTNFNFGYYLFSGDFRLGIFKDIIGDQFLSIISNKFSNNNFIFIPFYSVYLFLSFFSYHIILIYIFFGIPILSYISLKYVLTKITRSKAYTLTFNILLGGLAFYFAVSPSIFTRFGHWTILHGSIFLPLYVFFLYKYLSSPRIFNRSIFLLPILLYAGAMTPQLIIGYFLTTVFIYLLIPVVKSTTLNNYIIKGFLLIIGASLSFLHVIFPILIGYGKIKSALEGNTTSDILLNLSIKSNLVSSISGTNYYDELIKFPTPVSIGFLIFVLTVGLLIVLPTNKNEKKIDLLLMISILASLIVVAGYTVFPSIFDLLRSTSAANILWLIKDSNMYYVFLLTPILILFARLTSRLKNNSKITVYLAILLIVLHLFFIFSIKKSDYNSFYKFVDVPSEYFALEQHLSSIGGRNLWIPSDIYVGKQFAKGITYFPSPSLWLTRNKELTPSTEGYDNLLGIINEEIFKKDCKNKYFINWIISTQNLNVIIDKNSINNSYLQVYNTEKDTRVAERCLLSLPFLKKVSSFERISLYNATKKPSNEVYMYSGTISGLNKFLTNNFSNVVYKKSHKEMVDRLNLTDYTILNESYDPNWIDDNGLRSRYIVNMDSMLFTNNRSLEYRGERAFQLIVKFQLSLLALSFLAYIIITTFKKIYENK